MRYLNSYYVYVNVTKTKFICVIGGATDQPQQKYIQIHNSDQKVENTESTRYLFIVINRHLKYDDHTHYIMSKLRLQLHTFYFINDTFNYQQTINNYKALVILPRRYGIMSWEDTYRIHIQNMQKQEHEYVAYNYISRSKLNQETNKTLLQKKGYLCPKNTTKYRWILE